MILRKEISLFDQLREIDFSQVTETEFVIPAQDFTITIRRTEDIEEVIVETKRSEKVSLMVDEDGGLVILLHDNRGGVIDLLGVLHDKEVRS